MGPSLAVLGARESAPGGSDTRQLPPALSSGFVVAEMITLELFLKSIDFSVEEIRSPTLFSKRICHTDRKREIFSNQLESQCLLGVCFLPDYKFFTPSRP